MYMQLNPNKIQLKDRTNLFPIIRSISYLYNVFVSFIVMIPIPQLGRNGWPYQEIKDRFLF